MGDTHSPSRISSSIGLLFLCLPCDLTLNNFRRPLFLKLHLRPLHLDILAQFYIPCLGSPLRLNLSLLYLHLQFSLSHTIRRFCGGFLLLSLGLCDGRICLNPGDVLCGQPLLFFLANFSTHPSFGDVNFSLVESSLGGLAGEKGKVFGAGGVLELFDIGVIATPSLALWNHTVYCPDKLTFLAQTDSTQSGRWL